MTKLWQI